METTQNQRLLPLAGKPEGTLLIHEIYRSVQGESTFAGLPCVFVRLAVCDARCSWCDTPHAFTQGSVWTLDEILRKVTEFNIPLVEITGGEPLVQAEVFPLMTTLADRGLTVLLETSGAHDIAPVDRRVHIIMDLKCPDSGECEAIASPTWTFSNPAIRSSWSSPRAAILTGGLKPSAGTAWTSVSPSSSAPPSAW